jgi:hypothetical protein
MITYELARLHSLCIHKTGNKGKEEGYQLSKNLVETDEDIDQLLIHYFLSSFKENGYFQFFHETGLEMNEVYAYCSEIFDQPEQLYEQSVHLAKYLYGQSVHPNIKAGEFYTAYIQDCHLNGELTDVIGLFKSESKDTFLKIHNRNENFDVEQDQGININKLDKGCLIFNTRKEDGFVVAVIDRTNKESEARYWIDQFLQIKQRSDSFYNTEQIVNLCKSYIQKQLPEEYEVSKSDQAHFMNQSAKFLKEKDQFELVDFAHEVMQEPELVKSFSEYKAKYEDDLDVRIDDSFNISQAAIKKKQRVFKSVIKLDKNFHIYVHGKREYILKGFDEESGLNYYQIFFNEES